METVGFEFCALFPYLTNIAYVESLRGYTFCILRLRCFLFLHYHYYYFYYLLPLALKWELLIPCPNTNGEKRETINLIQNSVCSLMRLMLLIPVSACV